MHEHLKATLPLITFLNDLQNVETITVDTNAGYENIINEIFRLEKIIID